MFAAKPAVTGELAKVNVARLFVTDAPVVVRPGEEQTETDAPAIGRPEAESARSENGTF
jgi:hypothetical protein